MEVRGKRVWVTGASSGIGAALAVAFAEAGARVVLSARRQAELEQVAERCGDDSLVVTLDVTDQASIDAAVQRVNDAWGGVDILVNNAGITQRSRATETDMTVYRRLLEVNLFGTIALTSAMLPGMLERGEGQIVCMSSIAGKVGAPLRTGYCAAKHAVVGYCDALRAEVQDHGVHVLVVCPGFVNTPISYAALKGDGQTHGSMDADQAAGVPPETVASRTLQAINRGEHEILVGGKEILAAHLKRISPRLLARLTRRVAAQRSR